MKKVQKLSVFCLILLFFFMVPVQAGFFDFILNPFGDPEIAYWLAGDYNVSEEPIEEDGDEQIQIDSSEALLLSDIKRESIVLGKTCPHAKLIWHENCCWMSSSLQCFFKTKELTELLLETSEIQMKPNFNGNSVYAVNVLNEYVDLLKRAVFARGKRVETTVFYDLLFTGMYDAGMKGQYGNPVIFCHNFIELLQASSLVEDGFISEYTTNQPGSDYFKDRQVPIPQILVIPYLRILPKSKEKLFDEARVYAIGDKKYRYTVYAMVAGINGHFWAYGKDWNTGTWYYYDDLRKRADREADGVIKNLIEKGIDNKKYGEKNGYPHIFFCRREDA